MKVTNMVYAIQNSDRLVFLVMTTLPASPEHSAVSAFFLIFMYSKILFMIPIYDFYNDVTLDT